MKATYLILLLGCCLSVDAQILLKSEYFGGSSFRDMNNEKIGDTRGSASVHQAAFMIPVSMKINEKDQPTVWGIAASGSYTRFSNRNFPVRYSPREVTNLDLSLIHIRPISDKWSVMAMLGLGVYSPHARFSRIHARELLGNGGVVFIRHLRPNMDIGGGLVLNNSFGYPMVFPGFVFRWRLDGVYEVETQMMNAIELSAGRKMTPWLKLKVFGEMSGAGAFEKIDGKNMMYTHSYVNTGVRFEFLPGAGISIPVTLGCTPYRASYYQERSLKAFFSDEGEYDPHFSAAYYMSVSVRYGF